jgi:peptidoglycan/LPS O-acetylase OafA/YrhL
MHLKKLDAIRGFAAFYVIVYHIIHEIKSFPSSIKDIFFSFGQEAVMLFFLLSGFVIYVSVYNKENITFRDYFIKRARRIYFPFIIAILLSIFIAYLNGNLFQKFSWQSLLGNFFMLQDLAEVKPGIWFPPFLGNLPLWSLAYEWWFYMLFFPLYKKIFKNEYRIYFILAISFVSYIIYALVPNQLALYLTYFIIWWCGVEAADIYLRTQRFTWRSVKPIAICLFVMILLCAIPVALADKIQLGYYPFLILRHFVIVFIFILLGLVWYQNKLKYFDNILGGFIKIAPISYGLYIFHYPILVRWRLPGESHNMLITYPIKLILIFLLSYLIEIKLQPKINKIFK